MLKWAAAGIASLGLIGGTGAVVYHNDGEPTVKITNQRRGNAQSVRLETTGEKFWCPKDLDDEIRAYDLKMGRIKLTNEPLRQKIRRIAHQYPSGVASDRVVDHYNALIRHERRLTAAYDAEVHARNALIDRECDPRADDA
jgi:hypothetical protein